jgi:hypothetical protein
MARRRGNPNWGKPEPIGPVVPVVTSFEQAVKEFKLTPDQYIRSTRLREWARRNKNSKYIPEPLLEAWGFEIESTLYPRSNWFSKQAGPPFTWRPFFFAAAIHPAAFALQER